MSGRIARAAMALGVAPLVLVTAGYPHGAAGTTSEAAYGATSEVASAAGGGPSSYGFLDDVSAASANDVWAVGVGSATETETLVQHYDGRRWQRVSSPSPGDYAELLGVDAVDSDDVWAGGYATTRGRSETCVEHWDGSRWRRVASPNPGGRDAALFGLSARTASDVWSVGYVLRADDSTATLVEHWDGSQWRRVSDAGPQDSDQSALEAVGIWSAHDVWAVGYTQVRHPIHSLAFAEHWDGHAWTAVATPKIAGSAGFDSVTVVSPSNVWAVGRVDTDHGRTSLTLTEHWNGRRWAVVPSPSPRKGGGSLLAGVSGSSAKDLWAVGIRAGTHTMAEHWNGAKWRRIDTPDVGGFASGLTSTDVVASTDAWAAGFWAVGPSNEKPLVEHWDGDAWSVSER